MDKNYATLKISYYSNTNNIDSQHSATKFHQKSLIDVSRTPTTSGWSKTIDCLSTTWGISPMLSIIYESSSFSITATLMLTNLIIFKTKLSDGAIEINAK
jgi:hypothetical protein